MAQTTSNPSQSDNKVLNDAVRLWRRLHGTRQDLLGVFSAFLRNGELVNWAEQYFTPDQLDQAAAWVATQDRNGRECYFAVAQLFALKRLKDNAAPTRVVHADMDGAPLEACPVRPTVVVETSPDHYHVYWVLDRYIQPSKAEDLNRRLARIIGADKAATDAVRLMRVPGTHSRKRAERHVVRLLSVDDDDVHLDALERVLPAPERNLPNGGEISRPALSADDNELIARLGLVSELFGRLYAGVHDLQDDSAADWALAQDLLRATGDDQERVYRLMRQSGLERPKWDERRGDGDYLEYTIARAADHPSSQMRKDPSSSQWAHHVVGEPGPSNGTCSTHCQRHVQQIAALEAEIRQLRGQSARRAALYRRPKVELDASTKLLGEKLLNEQASRESRGEVGRFPVLVEGRDRTDRADWVDNSLASTIGVSDSTVRRDLNKLAPLDGSGLWVREYEPMIDTDGRPRTRMYLVPKAPADEQWQRILTFTPLADEKKPKPPAPPKANRCPKHPMAIINIDTTCTCTWCGRHTQPPVRDRFDPTDVEPLPITDPNVTGEAGPPLQFEGVGDQPPTVGTYAIQNDRPVLTDEQLAGLNRLYERAGSALRCDRRREERRLDRGHHRLVDGLNTLVSIPWPRARGEVLP